MEKYFLHVAVNLSDSKLQPSTSMRMQANHKEKLNMGRMKDLDSGWCHIQSTRKGGGGGGAVAKEIKEACSYGNSTRLSTINSVKKNNITVVSLYCVTVMRTESQ